MSQDTTRIVLYSHDALGLGHLRRNLALAHQLAHDLPRLTGAGVTGPRDRRVTVEIVT